MGTTTLLPICWNTRLNLSESESHSSDTPTRSWTLPDWCVQEVAENHAFRAYQARVLAESWEENIKWAEGMGKSSVITADKARYRAHLRWVRSRQAEAAAGADRHEGQVHYFEVVAPR